MWERNEDGDRVLTGEWFVAAYVWGRSRAWMEFADVRNLISFSNAYWRVIARLGCTSSFSLVADDVGVQYPGFREEALSSVETGPEVGDVLRPRVLRGRADDAPAARGAGRVDGRISAGCVWGARAGEASYAVQCH